MEQHNEERRTRRIFLQAGAAMATSALSYGRIIGANDRVRTALVGFSDRAKAALVPAFLLEAPAQNFDLVAVSDIWKVRREEGVSFVAERSGKQIDPVRNNDELYDRKDIDAVIISTADFQHAPHGVEAVRAGRDAYIEKPMAHRMVDARNLRQAIQETRRIVQIGTQRRSSQAAISAQEFVQSGQFGPICMVHLTSNFNQPFRWRRPELVARLRPEDTDWGRWRMNLTDDEWNPRKYIEFRLFWPYSSGMFDQWMVHQIDALHMISGLPRPRSAVAHGSIYQLRDGRTNPDTATAIFDYGPLKDETKGFQVVFSSRMTNSVGKTADHYFSEGGTLIVGSGSVSPEGGLTEKYAKQAGVKPNLLPEKKLFASGHSTGDELRADATISAHMRNWMECVRGRKQPIANIDAGYSHSIALCMAITALRTGKRATFDESKQEVVTI